MEEGENNSLAEIGKLSKLTSLNLWVKHICLIPEVDYLKRLKRFSIQFGGEADWSDYDIPDTRRTLILDTLDYADINSHSHVRKLIEVCNGIFLRSINNLDKLDKIMPMVYCEGFGLKTINIGECANLLYLVDSLDEMQTSFFSSIRNHEGVKENILSEVEGLVLYDLSSLKVIWNCADKYISLNNLVTLRIYKCPKLEKLFSVGVAQGLRNLKELTIEDCDSLKEVISDGDGETSTSEIDPVVPPKNIVFHRLAEIRLIGMESLTSFYPGNATIEYPSLVKVEIEGCDKMEKWGYGTHDTPKLQFVEINDTKANDSTIVEAWGKYKEVRKTHNCL